MIKITTKSKNLKTKEKTKNVLKTECLADWLNAMNGWVETHCDEKSIVTSYVRSNKITLFTVKKNTRYTFKIEWGA